MDIAEAGDATAVAAENAETVESSDAGEADAPEGAGEPQDPTAGAEAGADDEREPHPEAAGDGNAVGRRPGAAQPQHGGSPTGAPDPAGRQGLLYPLKQLGKARQLVLVMPRTWTGTVATMEGYELGPHGWGRVLGPRPARVGRTGMIAAARRLAGSGTTPAGTFPLSLAFGLEPDPGARLPYVHVTSEDHWWVADPSSPHYNELRMGASGGFLTREGGRRGSERIAAHPQEYAYAVVIDFNRPYPDRRLGACIALRGSTGLSTDGSVALEQEALIELLRWLDPDQEPVITMAPERVISQY